MEIVESLRNAMQRADVAAEACRRLRDAFNRGYEDFKKTSSYLQEELVIFQRAMIESEVISAPVDVELLPPEERKVFDLVGQGLSSADIAKRLKKTKKTIENQINDGRKKLQLPDTAAYRKLAVRKHQELQEKKP